MSDDICEVIITHDDPEWLAAFTRTLVQERLVACGAEWKNIYTRKELSVLVLRNVASDELVRLHAARELFSGTVAP